jgi:kynurenine formamidase
MRWGSPADYLNLDGHQLPRVPGFSDAALVLLLQERKVRGLGSDTPAGAPAATFADDAQWLLANLTSVEQLPPTGATLVIGALKIQGAAGSPVSVLAFLP